MWPGTNVNTGQLSRPGGGGGLSSPIEPTHPFPNWTAAWLHGTTPPSRRASPSRAPYCSASLSASSSFTLFRRAANPATREAEAGDPRLPRRSHAPEHAGHPDARGGTPPPPPQKTCPPWHRAGNRRERHAVGADPHLQNTVSDRSTAFATPSNGTSTSAAAPGAVHVAYERVHGPRDMAWLWLQPPSEPNLWRRSDQHVASLCRLQSCPPLFWSSQAWETAASRPRDRSLRPWDLRSARFASSLSIQVGADQRWLAPCDGRRGCSRSQRASRRRGGIGGGNLDVRKLLGSVGEAQPNVRFITA